MSVCVELKANLSATAGSWGLQRRSVYPLTGGCWCLCTAGCRPASYGQPARPIVPARERRVPVWRRTFSLPPPEAVFLLNDQIHFELILVAVMGEAQFAVTPAGLADQLLYDKAL